MYDYNHLMIGLWAYTNIKDQLCIHNTPWNGGRNLGIVNRNNLRPEAKLWNTFIKRNNIPTSHNHTVVKPRMVLIHAILTGIRFNVGHVIARELSDACKTTRVCLAFPYIVFPLYRLPAVPTHPTDKCTPRGILPQCLILFADMVNSNSSVSVDLFLARFDNAASGKRYQNVVAAKNIWEEQGFLYDYGLENHGLERVIHKRLSDLDWLRFD
ncbi:hypothetical protein GQ457_14G013540 [Hibiscus cannabinus]